MDALDDVIAACEEKRRLADVVLKKDAAIRRAHRELGLTQQEIARELHRRLVARGWSEEEIAAAGVSLGSVKAATRRR